jgi:hypothetical protein
MKKTLYLFFLCIAVQSDLLYSQFGQSNSVFEGVRALKARDGHKDLIYNSIAGSPYYSDDFVKSTVSYYDTIKVIAPLHYDMFQDEMEFKQGNNTLWLDKKLVSLIRYGAEKIVVAELPEENLKLAYFFMMNNGRYQLLIRKKVKYYPSVPPKGYSDPIPERFVREKDETYLKLQDQQLQSFKSKKELMNILGNKPEISDFINKEKIKIDNISGLIKLFDFLNNSK